MSREEVQEIRSRLADPEEAARLLNLDGKRQGSAVVCKCPVHGGRSLNLTRGGDGTLRAKCFGCDEVHGDVLSLIAAVYGLDARRDFPEVVRLAADLAGITLDNAVDGPRPPRRPPPPPPPVVPSLDDATFARLVAPIFTLGPLDSSPHVVDVDTYLERRGLRRSAACDGWAALPPVEAQRGLLQLLSDAIGDEAIACSGLVYATLDAAAGSARRFTVDGVEFSANVRRFLFGSARLVIPWRDPTGTVYTLQRRQIESSAEGPKYIFPSGPARRGRWPFGIERLRHAPPGTPIAFVEGALDVLALRRISEHHGVRRVVLGVPGVEGWRDEWETLLTGRAVTAALDEDGPGKECASRIAAAATRARAASIDKTKPPGGAKDWAEALERHRRSYE